MTRINQTIFARFCMFVFVGALNAQVTQTPLPASSSTASTLTGRQSPAYQLQVRVRRVVLDVVVVDALGKPVDGLAKEDFKVLEDGVIQPVRFFDVHNSSAGVSPQTPELHLPANTFSNLALAPLDKPVTILLYDMLNTPQAALPLAHQAVVKFIKDQKSSTQIAVFVLTDRLHMVQGFTDDETRLMAAVDLKNAKSQTSQLRIADTSAESSSTLLTADTTTTTVSAQQAPGSGTDPGVDPNAGATTGIRSGGAATPVGSDMVLEMLSGAEEAESAYLLRERLEITVNAFANIARFVSALPGRKNLIWMSGSFPSEILPNSTQTSGGRNEFSNAVFLEADVREAQEVLKESRVAIYPVDVRGLQVDTQFSAATRYSAAPAKVSTFGVEQGAEHATMDAIADSTGGRAFYNTNGLQQAMDSAVRQGSDYYSLTYAPSNSKADGAERTIKVVLKDPSYQLFYRRRYLADDAAHPSHLQTLVLDMNMQHGAPNSSELFFEAKVNPLGGSMAASREELDSLNTFLRTKATGKRTKIPDAPVSVQHYDINFAVIGRQLQMPPTGSGKYATNMTFGLGAYTRESELLNGMEVSIKNAIPAAQFQKIQSDGYHASMVFVVPDEAVSLRLAVRDEIGNRIGTMEIPLPIPRNTVAAATRAK